MHGPRATTLVLAIADVLEGAKIRADECDSLPSDYWETAYWCARAKASSPLAVPDADTRRHVRMVLEEREKHPDPFAGLPT